MKRLSSRPAAAHPLARGFSLVELMVGIVVSLVAVIVVMQVFRVAEGQRRTTTGGDDAQTTGAVALSLLQRDLRQAGQGLSMPELLGCQLVLATGKTLPVLAPIVINPSGIPAGDDNTDVVMINYGSGWGSPEGTLISSQSGSAYTVGAATSFAVDDRVIAVPQVRASPCALTLTNVSQAPTTSSVTVATSIASASNGVLFDMGRTPRFLVYAVRSSRLTLCDFLTQDCTSNDPDNWNEVADNVVSLRAQYARDTSAARDAIPDVYDQTTPTTCQLWGRVVGLRLAIVARNRQPEKAALQQAAPTWSGSADVPVTLPDGWQAYRYKSFETTLPLRNMPDGSNTTLTSC